ncbi:hypothetical protein D0T66_13160 [Dysgonomonas sp. 25]|nr:hypothetical protein [Dysgonomonas sp. 25]
MPINLLTDIFTGLTKENTLPARVAERIEHRGGSLLAIYRYLNLLKSLLFGIASKECDSDLCERKINPYNSIINQLKYA